MTVMAIVVAGTVIGPAAAETLHKVLASPLVEEGSDPDGCVPAVSGLGGPAVWQGRVERLVLGGKAPGGAPGGWGGWGARGGGRSGSNGCCSTARPWWRRATSRSPIVFRSASP